jgi:uncharacterized membrane protein YdbT with pleckstrin-like domain
VPDLVIQPTKKFVRLGYWTVFLLVCISVGLWVNQFQERLPWWPFLLPAVLFFFPVRSHVRQRFTKATLSGDKLHYETGVLARTTRTIQISKVQDVRVDQTLSQRLYRVGNLSIETAGETSRLTLRDIDDPQAVADDLTDAAQGQPMKRKTTQKGNA